jgi:hypothetical protein
MREQKNLGVKSSLLAVECWLSRHTHPTCATLCEQLTQASAPSLLKASVTDGTLLISVCIYCPFSTCLTKAIRALGASSDSKFISLTYAQSGVSVDTGNNLIDIIKPYVRSTRRPGADAEIGGFGGIFDLKATGYMDPVLVSSTDGVGTKLRVAVDVGIHHLVG